MSTEQVTRLENGSATVNGDPAVVDLRVDTYEGTVGVHLIDAEQADADIEPIASLSLSPVDAALHAERILAAARKAVADPTYMP